MRTVFVPPAILPGGPTTPGRIDLSLTLVDAFDQQVPVTDLPNATLYAGTHHYVITDAEVAIPLATQTELHGETYYRVEVRQGAALWKRRVQVPAAAGAPLTWAEFVGLTTPVAPPANRLVPDAALIADGWTLSVSDGQPVWSPMIHGAGDMQSLMYDPRGIRADAFLADHLTGVLDGGTF